MGDKIGVEGVGSRWRIYKGTGVSPRLREEGGEARGGEARRGVARRGEAWRGEARRGQGSSLSLPLQTLTVQSAGVQVPPVCERIDALTAMM